MGCLFKIKADHKALEAYKHPDDSLEDLLQDEHRPYNSTNLTSSMTLESPSRMLMGSHGRPGVRPGKEFPMRISNLKMGKVWMDDLHKHRTLERTFNLFVC